MAQALLMAGRLDEALPAFDAALAVAPTNLQIRFGRANVLKILGRAADALAEYNAVLAKMPDAAGALNNRGEARLALGDAAGALEDFAAALARSPGLGAAALGQGMALQALHRHAQALTALAHAALLSPDSSDVFFHAALSRQHLGDAAGAIEDYDRAIALEPGSVAAINNRSAVLMNQRRFAEASRGYVQLEAVAPAIALNGLATAALHACDWSRRGDYQQRLAAAIAAGERAIQPGTWLGYGDDPALTLKVGRNFVGPGAPEPLWKHTPFSGDKMRIAYVSANFGNHALSRLLAGVFEHHDRSRFEVIGISFSPEDGSALQARVRAGFDQFFDVQEKSAGEIAALIADLNVDIAVDLMGHTEGARTGIFAARCAPVQVQYMGYPGTLGADFYDYIIGDAVVTPPDAQGFYSETILPLVDTYWATDDKRERAAPEMSRAEAGLPDSGFVFCCFNNNWKITPELFDVWMRLLTAVPASVLWLIADSAEAAANLKREALARGVAADRLIFAPRVSPAEHLARHAHADLFLDTLPYNAHTTASDALWVGVPVVTCLGKSFPGRVAASILTAMGLPELISADLASYESLARTFAKDAGLLAALKDKVKAQRQTSALFDTARFTRSLEGGYEKMALRGSAV